MKSKITQRTSTYRIFTVLRVLDAEVSSDTENYRIDAPKVVSADDFGINDCIVDDIDSLYEIEIVRVFLVSRDNEDIIAHLEC